MISLYIAGDSLLHRCPAGLKLALFALWALGLTLGPALWPGLGSGVAALSVAVAVSAYVVAFGVGRGVRMLLGDLRALWLFYAVLLAFQWVVLGPVAAIASVGRVLGLVLAAQIVTRTTRIAAMVAVAEAVLTPLMRVPLLGPALNRVGIRPERVGLAMGLVLSSIGHLRALAVQIRHAQASRGVRMTPWAWVLPLLVLAFKHADDVGDALAARGID